MSQMKSISHLDNAPSTPGKFKMDKSPYIHRLRWHSSMAKIAFYSFVFVGILLVFFLRSPSPTSSAAAAADPARRALITSTWGGASWEKRVRSSARVRTPRGITVLVTGAGGFVGVHVSLALKRRGDGVLGLDNFNDYYDPSLKRDRQALLDRSGVFVVDGDINDGALLRKLFDVVPFSHVMHLAAQAGVRYAMQNPSSYVHSNIAGLVSVLEACKSANPQPAVVWASSSSVYGLNSKVPFSERDRTDQPASLYAATKKADILSGRSINIFEGPNHGTVARDFTYIDDIVKGCLASLDTAEKSTGSGGKKKAPAQLRVFNLGNTSPVPVTELVSILEKLLKVKANKKMLKMPRNGDVQFTHANISLAQKELGYKPTTDLQTGLKKFVKWYLGYYSSMGRKSVGAFSVDLPWSNLLPLLCGCLI
ncbi:UDP-glucuronate 4-epimerase 3-like protein [Cinnamomum micranthum f. kanehirae]|uniref:UDP-glucuronate 4-epimerase 3-like protein n=1 Tax=Cinnamomum micranthum f. kanehirae TaxID=337451 RepID=A0A3S3QMB0_9MAGN|nr:UDP-glucuronate 4-epimerase 3-like protein [Cinnamomum micranthum f. kanehirae]